MIGRNKSRKVSGYEYTYPGTNVLRNLLDIQCADKLEVIERRYTAYRIAQLQTIDCVKGRFDAAHLSALHKYIFQDVYEWAGKFRDVTIMKGNTVFVEPDKINTCLSQMHKIIKKAGRLDKLSKDGVVDLLTITLANLNKIHPFREGNGRTQRMFLEQLAYTGGYDLDFSDVSENLMRNASACADRKQFGLMRSMIADSLSKIDDDGNVRENEMTHKGHDTSDIDLI